MVWELVFLPIFLLKTEHPITDSITNSVLEKKG